MEEPQYPGNRILRITTRISNRSFQVPFTSLKGILADTNATT